jgi:hypothetical protein
MKRLLILGCITCIFQSSPAQKSSKRWAHYLKASVSESNKKSNDLYLADVNDTAVFLSADPARFRLAFMNTDSIRYQDLRVISVHRRGNVGRGALKGALIGGLGTGIIAATTIQCNDCADSGTRGLAFLGGGLAGGFLGALFGSIIGGASERRFIIGGDKKKFDKMRLTVLEMAYGKSVDWKN